MIPIFPKPNHKRRKPKRGDRGKITQKQRKLAYQEFGETCVICGDSPVELHHIVYKSQSGRGGWRNLIPLCRKHHDMAHDNSAFAIALKNEREEQYGEYFSCDRYDLREMGLIENATEQEFENFMRKEENK